MSRDDLSNLAPPKRRFSHVFDSRDPAVVDATGIDCSVEPSLTQQQFMDECDINQIVARYHRTEVINLRSDAASGRYADLSSMPDYREACDIVIAANEAFNSLDAGIRKKFDNDPAQFLAFVEDPSNVDELVRLGLAEAVPVAAPAAASGSPSGEPAPPGAGAPKAP